jgi:type I restriction enzyme S subunit
VVSHLAIVDALPQFLDDDFLYHWLCTLDMSQASQSEDGYPSLRLSDIAAFEIPLPPLAEQQRLVNRIESLTSRLEEARNARLSAADETANSCRSIIAAAFNSFNAAPTRRLGDIARIIGGNSIPEDGPRPASDIDRIGLMKVSDMNTVGNETMLRSCRLETTRVHAKEKRLRVVPAGAVVFPKRGGAIATNKKRTLAIPAALDPNMMGVFPMEGSGLSSEFLRWWFESIDLADLQEDGGIPQVNKKHLDPLEIPVPSFAEQNRLVERLDALAKKQTELRRLQAETEAELAAFTPALLAKAFRGEL